MTCSSGSNVKTGVWRLIPIAPVTCKHIIIIPVFAEHWARDVFKERV